MLFNKKKAGAFVALTAAAALLLTGCSSSDNGGDKGGDTGGDKGSSKITFLPKNLGNPYFDTSSKGGTTA
ncbi:MAG: rhamnose ABC transporter substrate-binding protein, partial [Actinobacteria bacterium]|nr:rhamnose ABC transporter substrate-binding protein [Actinomycetota bacterium]